MEEEYKYLWVLDFNDLTVYNYRVLLYANAWEYHKILEDVGHDLKHIEWMLSPYDEAINATSDLRKPSKYLEAMEQKRDEDRKLNTTTDR